MKKSSILFILYNNITYLKLYLTLLTYGFLARLNHPFRGTYFPPLRGYLLFPASDWSDPSGVLWARPFGGTCADLAAGGGRPTSTPYSSPAIRAIAIGLSALRPYWRPLSPSCSIHTPRARPAPIHRRYFELQARIPRPLCVL